VFLKIKVHLLVSEIYIYQNARCNDKRAITALKVSSIAEVLCMVLKVNSKKF